MCLRAKGWQRITAWPMGDEPDHKNLSPPRLESTNSILKQSIRFLLHLIAVYLIATIAVPRLSGWIYGSVLPIAEIHTTSLSRIEFMFSHLAALSLIAGFLAGLVNARFRHRVAQYVWTIPTGILLYNLATFTPQ